MTKMCIINKMNDGFTIDISENVFGKEAVK